MQIVLKSSYKNNKLILETQQRFRSEKHNDFTKEINKVASRWNDDKRIQLIDMHAEWRRI